MEACNCETRMMGLLGDQMGGGFCKEAYLLKFPEGSCSVVVTLVRNRRSHSSLSGPGLGPCKLNGQYFLKNLGNVSSSSC